MITTTTDLQPAMLRITNYLLLTFDCGVITLPILLDLSAVFDTIFLTNLLETRKWCRLSGYALAWFGSYLKLRSATYLIIFFDHIHWNQHYAPIEQHKLGCLRKKPALLAPPGACYLFCKNPPLPVHLFQSAQAGSFGPISAGLCKICLSITVPARATDPRPPRARSNITCIRLNS